MTSSTADRPTHSARRTGWAVATHVGHVSRCLLLDGPHWYALAVGAPDRPAPDVAATLAIDMIGAHSRRRSSPADVRAAVDAADTMIRSAATGVRAGMTATVIGMAPLTDGSMAVFGFGPSGPRRSDRVVVTHASRSVVVTVDQTGHVHGHTIADRSLPVDSDAQGVADGMLRNRPCERSSPLAAVLVVDLDIDGAGAPATGRASTRESVTAH